MDNTAVAQQWSLFDIPVGSRIVIVGRCGTGKSWLVRALIARFQYDCESAMVCHDAEDVFPFYGEFMSPDYIHQFPTIYSHELTRFITFERHSRLLVVDGALDLDLRMASYVNYKNDRLTSIFALQDPRLLRLHPTPTICFNALENYTWRVTNDFMIVCDNFTIPDTVPKFIDIGRRVEMKDAKQRLLNELVSVPAGRFKGLLLPDGGVEYQRQMACFGELANELK